MFVLARYLNQAAGQSDIYWSSRHARNTAG
jgi:cob(I)alamin adenosyltransferase